MIRFRLLVPLLCACFAAVPHGQAAESTGEGQSTAKASEISRQKIIAFLLDKATNLQADYGERIACMQALPFFMPDVEMPVRDMLRNGNLPQRQMAARLYGFLGKGIHEHVLFAACADKDFGVAENASHGLAHYARTVLTQEAVMGFLADKTVGESVHAILVGALSEKLIAKKSGTSSKVAPSDQRPRSLIQETALSLITSKAAAHARHGYHALAVIGSSDFSESFHERLLGCITKELRSTVRVAAAEVLYGLSNGRELLVAWLDDSDYHVRFAAAHTLMQHGENVTSKMVSLLSAPVPGIRSKAVLALGERQLTFIEDQVTALLGDPVWSVREAAVRALGMLPGRAVSRQLLAMQDDKRPEVQALALKVLDHKGVLGARKRLENMLRDERPTARLAALQVLTSSMAQSFLSTIITMIDDPVQDVACAAIDCLHSVDLPEAKDALYRATHDKRFVIMIYARRLTGTLGDLVLPVLHKN